MQNKKVLIISYYWPPAGGIGVQRWLHFSKYLAQKEVDITVVVPEKASYPLLDNTLEKEISPEIKVIRLSIWEPYSIAEKLSFKTQNLKEGKYSDKENNWKRKLSLFIRGNFFIPDARKFWIGPTYRYLKKYLQENTIDNVITTGPPHSVNLVGLKLKKQNKSINWIADFRDPWTEISYHENLELTQWARNKHLKLEKEVLQNADTVTAASFSDAESYKQKGAKNVISVTNGYETLSPNQSPKGDHFTIAYFGKLEKQRNPVNLWKAIENLIAENSELKNEIKIEIWGSVDESVKNDLENSNLSPILQFYSQVDYKRAQEAMQNSDLLIVSNFNNERSKGIIPGKLFEYLSTQKPILSVGPKEADVAAILDETQSGKHFSYNEFDSVKDYILSQFNNWKNGIKLQPTHAITQYSRKKIIEKIYDLLK